MSQLPIYRSKTVPYSAARLIAIVASSLFLVISLPPQPAQADGVVWVQIPYPCPGWNTT